MAALRDWQALLVAAACLAAFCGLWWWQGWRSGYEAGAQIVVDQYGVKSWALCQTGSRWERCAKTEDGGLVLFRWLR